MGDVIKLPRRLARKEANLGVAPGSGVVRAISVRLEPQFVWADQYPIRVVMHGTRDDHVAILSIEGAETLHATLGQIIADAKRGR
jgi:hypothetical protein